MASPLSFEREPELRNPVVILTFAGWNDGGEAASDAGRYLLESFQARRLAHIDCEEFLDLTVVRPRVRLEGGQREIAWPDYELYAVPLGVRDFDLVVGVGWEPHLRWRAYGAAIDEFVRRCDAAQVIILAALLGDVIYSRPVQVGGYTNDAELETRLGLTPSSYEGPTGIVGVLTDLLQRAAIPSLSLWATVPHYVSQTPYVRGSLALLKKLESVIEIPMDLSELESRAVEFDDTVSKMIAADPQLSAYVRELKRRAFSQ